ncbi:hypothetical protein [Streptomyces sp. ISL-11]|uniref:hypothetical protein n=1 Tax=Streptomyces sp. ISL-11 TaxID=2819174 RepID=UPI001BE543B6|nr:hypothetical protein [Streptomyces sp. ISL-11]MBT2384502.1 hypothetical protein [Streptomyces sp. ISL-11]
MSPSTANQNVSASEVLSAFGLQSIPEEIGHLVCCREPSWRTAFCGVQGDTINVAVKTICTMCVEQAETIWPGWWADPETFCPVDGQPCPDEHDIDQRIAWETGPPAP